MGNIYDRANTKFDNLSEDKNDVNLSRSGSFDTGYGGLDDATSGEGR